MKLFIGNLNPQTSEESLRTLFSEFGEIVSVAVPVDNETGMPRGFGFVEMADKFEGFDAIDNIDGTYFEGQVITVKESRPKNGGNRGGGGGFNRGGNRGGGGGFKRNSYGNNSRSGGGYGDRRSSRDSNSRDDRSSYQDPNRQPGRRFSPRGPRPSNED